MKRELASIGRLALRALGLTSLAGGLALGLAPAAQARTEISPYIEIQQVLTADLSEDDVLTYTSVAAGIDARTKTRRVEAQISYRYERRIAWQGNLNDEDVHSGLAQARVQIVPNVLSVDGGAIAARSRVDNRGDAPGFTSSDSLNVAEVYGIYAGPTFSTRVGALDVNAFYRLGYVAVDDGNRARLPLSAGQPRLDRYSSSTTHNLAASVGMGPGVLPVGWTLGAGYTREDTDRLDQSYDAKYVRGDVVFPIGPTLALTGGIGWEKIDQSQQDVQRDANGLVIFTPDGELIADPSRPRIRSYGQSGLIWDVGAIYRPSRRTELQARAGQRYGGTTVTGSLRHQFNSAYALNVSVYDSVDSFGRRVISDLASLPINFDVNRGGLNAGVGGIGGCVFGTDPGTGACLDSTFQSINTANFRNRGVSALFSGGRGPWDFGVGAGYNRRKYFQQESLGSFTLRDVVDQSATLQASVGRKITRTSGVNVDAYASWYDSGIAGSGNVFSTGVTGTYYRSFLLDRLQATASVGLYTSDSNGRDGTVASALLGLRYGF